MNHSDLIKSFPSKFQNRGNIPMVTYQLGDTVTKKIFNYKEIVNSVFDDEGV